MLAVIQACREEGGCAMGASAPPPPPRTRATEATEVHFFVDQQFGRLEVGTLMKDHDDQHC